MYLYEAWSDKGSSSENGKLTMRKIIIDGPPITAKENSKLQDPD
jgi:hypothetical protein